MSIRRYITAAVCAGAARDGGEPWSKVSLLVIPGVGYLFEPPDFNILAGHIKPPSGSDHTLTGQIKLPGWSEPSKSRLDVKLSLMENWTRDPNISEDLTNFLTTSCTVLAASRHYSNPCHSLGWGDNDPQRFRSAPLNHPQAAATSFHTVEIIVIK
ncbi:hypothetical protein Btru_046552 [Bulinus truncatus]|nr:hypothetical protein Btru_046552 [Bulinus truncatus]